jgi:hypothetical protein
MQVLEYIREQVKADNYEFSMPSTSVRMSIILVMVESA